MPIWVVTGANRGLGLEFITQLSTSPSNTIIAAVRSLSNNLTALSHLQTTSAAAALYILECDTGSQTSITTFSNQFAALFTPDTKIDFLLNNAGINATPAQTSLTMTPDSLANHMNINVMGPAFMVQALLPHLQRGSVVMNMGSVLSSLAYNSSKEVPDDTVYAISKAALNMLTVYQAAQLRERGVVVLSLDPGWVKTDMGGEGAEIEKEESISGILSVLRGAKEGDSGRFMRYDGSSKEW